MILITHKIKINITYIYLFFSSILGTVTDYLKVKNIAENSVLDEWNKQSKIYKLKHWKCLNCWESKTENWPTLVRRERQVNQNKVKPKVRFFRERGEERTKKWPRGLRWWCWVCGSLTEILQSFTSQILMFSRPSGGRSVSFIWEKNMQEDTASVSFIRPTWLSSQEWRTTNWNSKWRRKNSEVHLKDFYLLFTIIH